MEYHRIENNDIQDGIRANNSNIPNHLQKENTTGPDPFTGANVESNRLWKQAEKQAEKSRTFPNTLWMKPIDTYQFWIQSIYDQSEKYNNHMQYNTINSEFLGTYNQRCNRLYEASRRMTSLKKILDKSDDELLKQAPKRRACASLRTVKARAQKMYLTEADLSERRHWRSERRLPNKGRMELTQLAKAFEKLEDPEDSHPFMIVQEEVMESVHAIKGRYRNAFEQAGKDAAEDIWQETQRESKRGAILGTKGAIREFSVEEANKLKNNIAYTIRKALREEYRESPQGSYEAAVKESISKFMDNKDIICAIKDAMGRNIEEMVYQIKCGEIYADRYIYEKTYKSRVRSCTENAIEEADENITAVVRKIDLRSCQ